MVYVIKLKQDLSNELGQKIFSVQDDPLTGDIITVGNYRTHLSNVLYIKEV